MYCNGIRLNLFIFLCAIFDLGLLNIAMAEVLPILATMNPVTSQVATGTGSDANSIPDSLYDVVKNRWDKFRVELSNDLIFGNDEMNEIQNRATHTSQVLKDRADEFHKNLLVNPQTVLQLQSAPATNNYDIFNQQLILNPGTAAGNTEDDGLDGHSNEARDMSKDISSSAVQPMPFLFGVLPNRMDKPVDSDITGDQHPAQDISRINLAEYINDNDATIGGDISSSYPGVLTKAIERNMDQNAPHMSPSHLLANMAKQMNTSTLKLAEQLISVSEQDKAAISRDPKLTALLQKNIMQTVAAKPKTTAVVAPTISILPKDKIPDVNRHPKASNNEESGDSDDDNVDAADAAEECDTDDHTETPSHISEVLEKVLNKLDIMQCCGANNTTTNKTIDGAPCELVGSWHSQDMGIRFDMGIAKTNERHLSEAEIGNKPLHITVKERLPPKPKRLVTVDWKFMGSCLDPIGGPFYMYSQQRKDHLISLFTGYCRTCNGLDTIFGSWTFVYPSKDCQDITASVEHRADIFRRNQLEAKRKQRFKDLLFEKSQYGRSQLCKKTGKRMASCCVGLGK